MLIARGRPTRRPRSACICQLRLRGPTWSRATLRSVKVLVVDDQPNIVDMVAVVLRFHGFEVSTASTAREALRKAADERPELIVLDVMLPDGDGFEVCRTLRADGHRSGGVFLTGCGAPADQRA